MRACAASMKRMNSVIRIHISPSTAQLPEILHMIEVLVTIRVIRVFGKNHPDFEPFAYADECAAWLDLQHR